MALRPPSPIINGRTGRNTPRPAVPPWSSSPAIPRRRLPAGGIGPPRRPVSMEPRRRMHLPFPAAGPYRRWRANPSADPELPHLGELFHMVLAASAKLDFAFPRPVCLGEWRLYQSFQIAGKNRRSRMLTAIFFFFLVYQDDMRLFSSISFLFLPLGVY